MKTALPRPLTPHQWRRLVKIYRRFREPRNVSGVFCHIPPALYPAGFPAKLAWKYAKETLFPLNYP